MFERPFYKRIKIPDTEERKKELGNLLIKKECLIWEYSRLYEGRVKEVYDDYLFIEYVDKSEKRISFNKLAEIFVKIKDENFIQKIKDFY